MAESPKKTRPALTKWLQTQTHWIYSFGLHNIGRYFIGGMRLPMIPAWREIMTPQHRPRMKGPCTEEQRIHFPVFSFLSDNWQLKIIDCSWCFTVWSVADEVLLRRLTLWRQRHIGPRGHKRFLEVTKWKWNSAVRWRRKQGIQNRNLCISD